MGVNVRLTGADEGDHETDLATTAGLSALCGWFELLPDGQFPALRALAHSGTFAGTDVVVAQSERALKAHPPGDPGAAEVAERLLDVLGDGRAGETVRFVS